MCFPEGEFLVSESDVHLGNLDVGKPDPVPVWMSREQFNYWSHTHLPSTSSPAAAPASRSRRRPAVDSLAGLG
jgi:uncharacterized protein (DUF779 family)